MTVDPTTMEIYAERASADATLTAFMAALAPGARVLDLGCGPGGSAALILAAGLVVDAVDASAEMVDLAWKLHGIKARVAAFEDLDAVAEYDAVWASFSLLHAPKAAMPDLLVRIKRALRPGGRLGLGMKTGTGEGRDGLGRFYAYYTPDELQDLLTAAGFTVEAQQTGHAVGLDDTDAPWIWITARG